MHRCGHERISRAIESAWFASGFTPVTLGNEENRRFMAYLNGPKLKEDIARAKADEETKRKLEQAAAEEKQAIDDAKEIAAVGELRASGRKLLPRAKHETPERIKAAEDKLLQLLPALGSGLTMDDATFLMDVHRSGNKRVSPAIERAWAASKVIQAWIAQLREKMA